MRENNDRRKFGNSSSRNSGAGRNTRRSFSGEGRSEESGRSSSGRSGGFQKSKSTGFSKNSGFSKSSGNTRRSGFRKNESGSRSSYETRNSSSNDGFRRLTRTEREEKYANRIKPDIQEKQYEEEMKVQDTVELESNDSEQEESRADELLIGRNPIKEALKVNRDIDSIYINANVEDNLRDIISLAKDKKVIVKKVPKSKIDDMCKFYLGNIANINHQGVIAKVATVEYKTIDDAIKLAEDRNEPLFLIGLDGIEDPHNLGAIVRSAEIFGAHGVIIPKRRSVSMTATAAKSASGAEEYIPIIKVSNLVAAIDEIKQRGVFVAAADMSGNTLDKVNLRGAMMIIIGAEGKGVSRLVKDHCDFTASIEMYGNLQSLNASSAAAIFMYEKKRQDKLSK